MVKYAPPHPHQKISIQSGEINTALLGSSSVIQKITPSRMLEKISPVPKIPDTRAVKIVTKNIATVLNSPENIAGNEEKNEKIKES